MLHESLESLDHLGICFRRLRAILTFAIGLMFEVMAAFNCFRLPRIYEFTELWNQTYLPILLYILQL
jgi:hypothetical protein